MVESEHLEVIEGRRWLVFTDVLDPDEVAEDDYIDDYGDDFYEEDESGLGDADDSTGVTEVEKK